MLYRHSNWNQLWTRVRLPLLLFLGLVAYREAPALAFSISPPLASSSLPQSCQSLGKSSPETSQLLLSASYHPSFDSFHALGESFSQQADFVCAAEAYKMALELNPQAWQTRYSFGLALLQSGDSDGAVKELRSVIEQEPNSCMAHNALGLALESLADLEAARQEYEEA